MTDTDKKERVASALFDLTDREALTWEQFSPDATELPDDLPVAEEGSVFAALHDEMDLYLYPQAEGGADETTPRLAVTDPESGAGWTFPTMEVVQDLYELVQFRASGLEDWMDQVIAEAEDLGAAGDAPDGEAPGDAEDPVPSWADDAAEDDASPDDEAPADEDEPSDDSSTLDDGDEAPPDVFGSGNGTAGETERP